MGQNVICKSVPGGQWVSLDSRVIEPGSIQTTLPFQYVDSTQSIFFPSQPDSIKVCYRILSSILTQTYSHRDTAIYDDSGFTIKRISPPSAAKKEELFELNGLEKYGAISRGITFGNRQNLFVNSTLNLQMQGKLDDNLFVSALITDQNVPYQPEGNTQQIRDFDNVYISIYNDQFDLTAGDIVLQQPSDAGYFLRYYKNIQGLQASIRGGDKWKYESRISGALSKGKFNSAIVTPVDGLSGPYKLRGPNGERFIIVLANSEKVFLDGTLMQRGFDRDYVIDYNLGEITFNNHIVITQFSIIRVDYEYSEQFYNRTNLSAYQSLSNDRVKVYANFYRERDNPNASLGFSLGEDDLNQLRQIGDNVNQAFITGFDSVGFSANRVLYERVDTVDFDGFTQTIFIYSTNSGAEVFSPTFSNVGSGNGNYVLRNATANGKIYEWISPINGVLQGDYEPGAFIPLPNQRQMMSLGSEVKLSKYESVKTEVAFTNRDNNLYSDLDDGDNISRGYYAAAQTKGRPSFINNYSVEASLAMEIDEKDFTFIDRYRSILFDRDWNFDQNAAEASNDFLFFGKVGLRKDPSNEVTYAMNRRARGDQINGWQQELVVNQLIKPFQFTSNHFYLSNDRMNTQTTWWRSKSDLRFIQWNIQPGVIYEIDENQIAIGDSTINSLMNFRATEFYLTSGDSSQALYRISYQNRQDRLPVGGEFQDYLQSKNIRASYSKNSDDGRLTMDLNYRKVDDQLNLNVGEDEVINGRIQWVKGFFDRHLSHNFSFSTGNSRELRREFIYLPVGGGEGTHTWRDLNEDGIQDLNEFFEAINPDERNYVKIFTPTDDYITSFQTFYLHTIDAKLPGHWRGDGAVKSFLSKVSFNVNFNVNFKTTSMSYLDRLNPFGINLTDTNFISAQDSKRYTLFFNRNGRGFGADFTLQNSDNKQLLIQGYELRSREEWISNFKIDLNNEYTFRMSTSIGSQLNTSDFLVSRNFELVTASYKPQLIWQPMRYLRLIGSYERKRKRNVFTETSNEETTHQSYTGELTWNKLSKGSLRGVFSIVTIDFSGDPGTYLGYLMLDALQPGINQTWQINWQQRLSKGMQLSLIYNGRKSEEVKAIHTGSVQVTAFF